MIITSVYVKLKICWTSIYCGCVYIVMLLILHVGVMCARNIMIVHRFLMVFHIVLLTLLYIYTYTIDFVIDLSLSNSSKSVFSIVNKLTKFIRLINYYMGEGECYTT